MSHKSCVKKHTSKKCGACNTEIFLIEKKNVLPANFDVILGPTNPGENTYNLSAGVASIILFLVGGGGGGSGGTPTITVTSPQSGVGGGGASTIAQLTLALNPKYSTKIVYSVATGGAGGAVDQSGANGGASYLYGVYQKGKNLLDVLPQLPLIAEGGGGGNLNYYPGVPVAVLAGGGGGITNVTSVPLGTGNSNGFPAVGGVGDAIYTVGGSGGNGGGSLFVPPTQGYSVDYTYSGGDIFFLPGGGGGYTGQNGAEIRSPLPIAETPATVPGLAGLNFLPGILAVSVPGEPVLTDQVFPLGGGGGGASYGRGGNGGSTSIPQVLASNGLWGGGGGGGAIGNTGGNGGDGTLIISATSA